MKPSIYLMSLFVLFVSIGLCSNGLVAASDRVDLRHLEKVVSESYDKRLKALLNETSSGTAFVEVIGGPGPDTTIKKYIVFWFNNGWRFKRVDTIVQGVGRGDINAKPDARATPHYVRWIETPSRRLCYDVLNDQLYEGRHSVPYKPPIDLDLGLTWPSHWDKDFTLFWRIYQQHLAAVPGKLKNQNTDAPAPAIRNETVDGKDCITLSWDYGVVRDEDGAIKENRGTFEMWLAPRMGYSLIKAESYRTDYYDKAKTFLYATWKADYTESTNRPGIWLIKHVEFSDPFVQRVKLKVQFKDVELGVKIPENIFKLEGLGASPGHPVVETPDFSLLWGSPDVRKQYDDYHKKTGNGE